MNIKWLFENFFWMIFLGIGGTFAWKMWKNGGMRGAMFGSRVEALVGEVDGKKHALHSLKVRVHRLQGTEGRGEIGLELVAKSFASYHMTPLVLSKESALRLAEVLTEAARGSQAPKRL